MKTFFTACTHFNHTNIIKYCDRPFSSVEIMNQTIQYNWNSKVTPEDEIYILGDFALNCTSEWACNFVDSLNGKKYFIRGNHDRRLLEDKSFFNKFIWVRNQHYLMMDNIKILLTHYEKPNFKINHNINYDLHLYAHDHAKVPTKNGNNKLYNVGVDANNFSPVEFNEILQCLKK